MLSVHRHSPQIQLVTVAMITSRVEGFKLDGDVHMSEWERAGLLHPSVLRLSKVATLDRQLIEKALGRLMAPDLKITQKMVQKRFPFWN